MTNNAKTDPPPTTFRQVASLAGKDTKGAEKAIFAGFIMGLGLSLLGETDSAGPSIDDVINPSYISKNPLHNADKYLSCTMGIHGFASYPFQLLWKSTRHVPVLNIATYLTYATSSVALYTAFGVIGQGAVAAGGVADVIEGTGSVLFSKKAKTANQEESIELETFSSTQAQKPGPTKLARLSAAV